MFIQCCCKLHPIAMPWIGQKAQLHQYLSVWKTGFIHSTEKRPKIIIYTTTVQQQQQQWQQQHTCTCNITPLYNIYVILTIRSGIDQWKIPEQKVNSTIRIENNVHAHIGDVMSATCYIILFFRMCYIAENNILLQNQ